jgi:V/A-type H+-transporting ATPase subunit A
MSNTGIIYGVNGPVIYLKGDSGFKISEMVYVGPEHLVGEIIGLKKGMTTVQVFEETTGLKPGDTVTGTGDAISVLLGPGIIHNIFDGIQRLPKPQANIFHEVSALILLTQKRNGTLTS